MKIPIPFRICFVAGDGFPRLGLTHRMTKGSHPGDVTIRKGCDFQFELRLIKMRGGMFVCQHVLNQHAKRSGRVHDATPDFSCFPDSSVGSVVLKTNHKRNCGADQRHWRPGNF